MKKVLVSFIMAAAIAAPAIGFAQTADDTAIANMKAQLFSLQSQLNAILKGNPIPPTVPPSVGISGSAGASVGSTGPGIPIPPPIFDNDTSNDDIVQLNNLRIQSISGTQLPVIISASSEFGVQCMRYQSETSASGIAFPCPVPPTILYQIRVDDTILLLRNRARARISDFAVGDRINVYGFMDRNTQTVDALIIRDLDKPAVKQYIQLNNMEVVSGPSSNTLPATVIVTQNVVSPCLDYGMNGSGGAPIPCPMGIESRDALQGAPGSAGATSGGAASMYYPMPRRYVISIDRNTKIVSRDRSQVLSLADISIGDTLNIYGQYSQSEGAVTALIIRDLSKPQKLGLLQVTVADGSIMCMQARAGSASTDGAPPPSMSASIAAPCGILYNATVRLYSEQGGQWTRTTEKGTAFFENLQAGQYTILADAPGYSPVRQSAAVQTGQLNITGISLSRPDESATIRIRTDSSSSLSGYVGRDFRAFFLASGGEQPYAWKVTAGALPDGLTITPPPPAPISCMPNGGCPILQPTSILIAGKPLRADVYKFTLMATDRFGNSGSETFVVTINNPSPAVISIRTDSELTAYAGKSFMATFTGSGGEPSYSWSITAGELPPGFAILNPPMPMIACRIDGPCPPYKQMSTWIGGIPQRAGTYKFVLSATDMMGNTGSETFVITVNPGFGNSLSATPPPTSVPGTANAY